VPQRLSAIVSSASGLSAELPATAQMPAILPSARGLSGGSEQVPPGVPAYMPSSSRVP